MCVVWQEAPLSGSSMACSIPSIPFEVAEELLLPHRRAENCVVRKWDCKRLTTSKAPPPLSVVSLLLEDSFQPKAIRVNQKSRIISFPITFSYSRWSVTLAPVTNTGCEELIDALAVWSVECKMGPQPWGVRVLSTLDDGHRFMLSIKTESQDSPLGVIEDE